MFANFFYELKSARVPVTLKEYLTLMEAMQADGVEWGEDYRAAASQARAL